MKSDFTLNLGIKPSVLTLGLCLSGALFSFAQEATTDHIIPDGQVILKNRSYISDSEHILASDIRNDNYLILNFTDAIPSPQELKNLGISSLHFLSSKSIYAHVPTTLVLSAIPSFEWASTLSKVDKIHSELSTHFTRNSRVNVLIYLPSNLSTTEVDNFTNAHDILVKTNKILPDHVVFTELSDAELSEIAEDNLVSWVAAAPHHVITGEPFHFCAGAMTPYGPQAEFAQTQKFVLQGSDWDGPGLGCADLTYHFENGTPDLPGTTEWDIVRDAMQEWVGVAGLTFTETPTVGLDNSLDIAWESGDHGDGSSFDGPNGTLAHAFFPQFGGEMHFDEAETWTNTSANFNLYAVAVHELGHALGLSHSENSSAVMAPFYAGVITGLHPDDIAGIRALYSATPCGTPTLYCSSSGTNSNFEWIEKVIVSGTTKTSGNNGGYEDFTGSAAIPLNVGTTSDVTLTPGFSNTTYNEFWNIWIDYNKNNTFDASERVYSGSGTGVVSGSFTVPAGLTGTTRMRISMKYNANGTPCETFQYGEVEDYTVSFQSAPTVNYCTSKGNNSNFEWIANVNIAGAANASGNDGGYKDNTNLFFPVSTGNNTISLTPGFSGTTYNEFWNVWVDLNENGTFEGSELVYSANGSSVVSGTFSIPTSYAGVTTRIRVSMKYNSNATPCETFTYGEVEDYLIQVSSANITATIDESNAQSFLLYPNPVDNGILTIQSPMTNPTYQVFDTAGKLLISGNLINNSLDVGTLKKGHYLIRLTDKELSKTMSFVKR